MAFDLATALCGAGDLSGSCPGITAAKAGAALKSTIITNVARMDDIPDNENSLWSFQADG